MITKRSTSYKTLALCSRNLEQCEINWSDIFKQFKFSRNPSYHSSLVYLLGWWHYLWPWHKYFSQITENTFQKVLANAKFFSCLFFILFHFSFSVEDCALLEVRVHASSFVYSLHKGDLVQYMFVQLNQVASLDKALSCLMFKSEE